VPGKGYVIVGKVLARSEKSDQPSPERGCVQTEEPKGAHGARNGYGGKSSKQIIH